MLFATLIAEGRPDVATLSFEANRYWPVEALVGGPVSGMIEAVCAEGLRNGGADEGPSTPRHHYGPDYFGLPT